MIYMYLISLMGIFILGLFIGSFLNLVSDRFLSNEKFVFGRSHCDFCKKNLGIKNLVPLLSYIFQKGKCSYCSKKLSKYYPMSEILSGLLLATAFYLSNVYENQSMGNILMFIFYSIVFSSYLVMLLTDLKRMIIPDKMVYATIAFVVLFVVGTKVFDLYNYYQKLSSDVFGTYLIKAGFFDRQVKFALRSTANLFTSSFGIAGFFMFLVLITKGRGMGGGDIKLGFLIGLVNGFPYNILAVFLGFLIGSIYSIVLIVLKKKGVKDVIPFGPFLILGSILALVFGSGMIGWYFSLMN